ncbi:hypothetical protein ALC62_15008, partial [Cyphomyrmex costatus]
SNIPSDPRTLLHTPRNTDVRNCAGGEYYHFGLLKSIENFFLTAPINVTNIKISVNIDGLPLSKSSQQQLWPILGSIGESKQVFIIGIYYGKQKPCNPNDFLKEFIEETKLLCNNGIVIDKHIQCSINSIICDAPAKAFVLQIKGHTGYSSCTKCTTEGDFRCNKVCFPQINAPLRTDLEFRLKNDEDHHIGKSIIEEIPNFDLINNVPLDYMHLVCLGVMRRLLYLWLFGNLKFRLENRKCQIISSNLENVLKIHVPFEFVRKPRSLNLVKLWKATEYRQLLLYTGPVAFKNILRSDIYDHFITLHVAIRILCSTHLQNLYDYSQELLEHFVKSFALIYGIHNISHNVHGLIHLVRDAKKFGTLDNFSAFKYENFLQTLKKLLKKYDKPLQQIVRRCVEYEKNKVTEKLPTEENKNFIVDLKSTHSFGPLIHGCCNPQYKIIRKTNMTLRIDVIGDNCCALIDGTIVLIKNIAYNKDLEINVIIGHKFLHKQDFYHVPCPSSLLQIFTVYGLSDLQMWPIENIHTKYVKLPLLENEYVVFPLLH